MAIMRMNRWLQLKVMMLGREDFWEGGHRIDMVDICSMTDIIRASFG